MAGRFSPGSAAVVVVSVLAAIPAHAGHGHVSYVTRVHAFLDVGSEDGLRAGEELTLQGPQGGSKTCKVETVSEHHARCLGENLPKRARFSFNGRPPSTPPVSRTMHFAPLTRGRAHEIQSTLAASPFADVPNTAVSRRVFGGALSLHHDAWLWFGAQPRTLQGERLEVAARLAPFAAAPDLAFALRASALLWTQQSQIALRFRNGDSAQFYLWQGDVSMRGARNNLVFGAGRTLTWYTPGLAVLDGVQVGYRSDDTDAEIGVFAGIIPNPSQLLFNDDHITAGLYTHAQGHLGDVWVLSNAARLAYNSLPRSLSRVELEDRLEFSHGSAFQAALSPRVGYGVSGSGFSLDAVRADISSQVSETLNLYVGARYANGQLDIANGIVAPPQILRSTFFSDVTGTYQLNSDIAVGLINAVARDNDNGYTHVSTGPQLRFPRLFGRYGDLSVMGLVEQSTYPQTTTTQFGSPSVVTGVDAWQNSGSVFLSTMLTPHEDVRVWARLSWMADVYQTDSLLQQLGLYVRAEASITEWLGLGGYLRMNQGLVSKYVALSEPTNIVASLQLTGRI